MAAIVNKAYLHEKIMRLLINDIHACKIFTLIGKSCLFSIRQSFSTLGAGGFFSKVRDNAAPVEGKDQGLKKKAPGASVPSGKSIQKLNLFADWTLHL